MKHIFIAFLAVCALVFGVAGCSCNHNATEQATAEEEIIRHRLGFDPDTLHMESGTIRNGDYFTSWITKLGMDATDAYNLATACDSVFNVRKLRSGNPWQAYYSFGADSVKTLEYVVYERDSETDVVFRCKGNPAAVISEKPVETFVRYAEVEITSSLWNDMLHAGLTPLLILKLSDIYAWTIDFFALQRGDSFKVCYEERHCDDKIVAVDTIRFASFTHGDKVFKIIMFDQGDGGNVYWNEKGESVRKAFLKAPLNYSRISSGYSTARRHPVTRKVQPHTGVDYAAPVGTPVLAVGDGKVISAKNEGAGGNVVRIRHNSVYTTGYLHLSKFGPGIKAGAMVKQGDIIGYVGATGRVTGPHLDYRVWQNGSPINPLTMESPPAEPVAEGNMPVFTRLVDSLTVIADSLNRQMASDTVAVFTLETFSKPTSAAVFPE